MDFENRTYSCIILITVYKNVCFGWVNETSPWNDSMTHTKHILYFKTDNFGGYILLCRRPYYLNY